MLDVGTRVRWAGERNPWCAPGFHGTVLAVARNDHDSVKVEWDERHPAWSYTWERRANLRDASQPPLGVASN